MADVDEVGDAIDAQDVARIQRGTNLENQLVGRGRPPVAPIAPGTPDPVGAAIKQNEVERIRRGTDLENQLVGGASPAATNWNGAGRSAPSPDDLIEGAIAGKRNMIEAQQAKLRGDLAVVSGDKYGERERAKIGEQYGMLQHADLILQHDQHERALVKAKLSAHEATIQSEAATSHDIAGYYQDKAKIESNFVHGSPEERAALLALPVKYPRIVKSADTLKDFREHIESHDNASDMRAKAAAELGIPVEQLDKSFQQKSITVGGTPGQNRVTYQRKAEDDTTKELEKGYGLTKSALLNPVRIRAGKIDEKTGAFTNQFAGAEEGPIVEITSGKGKPIAMPASEYHRFIQAFGGTPAPGIGKPLTAVAEQSQPAPEEKVLVQKDGKQFRLPKSQVDEALKQKYELVK